MGSNPTGGTVLSLYCLAYMKSTIKSHEQSFAQITTIRQKKDGLSNYREIYKSME